MPRWQFSFAVAAALALPLLLMVSIQSPLDFFEHQGTWRLAMAPAIIVFTCQTHPWLQRHWKLAVDVLMSLNNRSAPIENNFAARRLGEWIAILLGAGFAVWISHARSFTWQWQFTYFLVTNVAMFSLIGLQIYDSLFRTMLLRRAFDVSLNLDLFDRQTLPLVARFGQCVSLTFVGGICLSLLFQSYDSLYKVQSLVTYSILVVVALTLFLVPIWSVHIALVAAQTRELANIRAHWSQARSVLYQNPTSFSVNSIDAAKLYGAVVTFGAYEKQVLNASTWPFNSKMIQELVASVAASMLIYGLKLVTGLSKFP